MENLDTDIDKYSVDDLLTILNLNEPTEYQVQDATNTIIANMRSEGNVEMADFFEEVKQKLLEEFKTTVNDFGDNEQDDEETTIGNWWQNEYPAQNNEVQADKVTNRKQRVQFFDNEYFQMNREQLGVNQDYSVPVAQGTLNPKLKNTVTRLVSIDSQYRDNVLAVEGGQPSYSSPAFNSSFTVNLSESLKSVISLKLYSIELPTTWYTFDDVLGNTCFKIKADGGANKCYKGPLPDTDSEPDEDSNNFSITISTPPQLITEGTVSPTENMLESAEVSEIQGTTLTSNDGTSVAFQLDISQDGLFDNGTNTVSFYVEPSDEALYSSNFMTASCQNSDLFKTNDNASKAYASITNFIGATAEYTGTNEDQGSGSMTITDSALGLSDPIIIPYSNGLNVTPPSAVVGLSDYPTIDSQSYNGVIIDQGTYQAIAQRLDDNNKPPEAWNTSDPSFDIGSGAAYAWKTFNTPSSTQLGISDSQQFFTIFNTMVGITAKFIDPNSEPEPEPEPEQEPEPEPEPDEIDCQGIADQCYCINPGNYDILSLTEEIVRVASPDISLNFKIEPSTNIISIRQDPKGNIIYPDASFVYYDCNGLGCVYPCIGSSYINQNLGWYLGFRRQPDESGVISIPLSMTEWVTADVPANTYGPKYCMLVLDDFNKNRLNKGIVGISDTSTKLDLPAYYSPSDISGCSKNDNCSNRVDTPIVWVSDDKPKTLTNSQLYTIQETLNNRIQPTGRITAPTTSDVLARIPLKNVTALRPEPLIETGSQLQTNEREYFGPVDIERIKVSLVDDKGYPLNLHDNDWSFSLIVEQLYQY